MELIIATLLENLVFAGEFEFDNCHVAADIERMKVFSEDKGFVEYAGKQRLKRTGAPHFHGSIQVEEKGELSQDWISGSVQIYTSLDSLLMGLWLIKDCAVSRSDGLEKCLINRKVLYGISMSKNQISNCWGEYLATSFTNEEIQDALGLAEGLRDLQSQHDKQLPDAAILTVEQHGSPLPMHTVQGPTVLSSHNDFSRFRRANLSIWLARLSPVVQFKVSSYVTAIECLFTAKESELQHRTCERVAFFLGGDGAERKSIYDKVQAAYDARSAFVHGSEKHSKLNRDKIREIAKDVDDIVRRSMVKIIKSESKNFLTDAIVVEYFKKMILGY